MFSIIHKIFRPVYRTIKRPMPGKDSGVIVIVERKTPFGWVVLTRAPVNYVMVFDSVGVAIDFINSMHRHRKPIIINKGYSIRTNC